MKQYLHCLQLYIKPVVLDKYKQHFAFNISFLAISLETNVIVIVTLVQGQMVLLHYTTKSKTKQNILSVLNLVYCYKEVTN